MAVGGFRKCSFVISVLSFELLFMVGKRKECSLASLGISSSGHCLLLCLAAALLLLRLSHSEPRCDCYDSCNQQSLTHG